MSMGSIHLFVEAGLFGGSELEDEIGEVLRGDGFAVGAPGSGVTRGGFPGGDIMVQILDAIESHLVDATVGAIVGSMAPLLKRLRREKRVERVAIMGSRGEILRMVELPDPEDVPLP